MSTDDGCPSRPSVRVSITPASVTGPGGTTQEDATPTQDVVPPLSGDPTYGGDCSWFGAPSRDVEARGNPVWVRDCPAAVSGNDRRHEALDREVWEATASRCRETRPRVRRPA